jgi:hypothetical protein
MTTGMTVDFDTDHRWRDKTWLAKASMAARDLGFPYRQQAADIDCDYSAFQQLQHRNALGEDYRQRLLEWLIEKGIAREDPADRTLPLGNVTDTAREDPEPTPVQAYEILPIDEFVKAIFLANELQDREATEKLRELHEQRQAVHDEIAAMRDTFDRIYAHLKTNQRNRPPAPPPQGKSAQLPRNTPRRRKHEMD